MFYGTQPPTEFQRSNKCILADYYCYYYCLLYVSYHTNVVDASVVWIYTIVSPAFLFTWFVYNYY